MENNVQNESNEQKNGQNGQNYVVFKNETQRKYIEIQPKAFLLTNIFLLIKIRMPQILIWSLKLEPPQIPRIQADLKTLPKVLLKAQCFRKASQN